MKDYDFEEKKKRILSSSYEGEEWKLIYMWVKQNKITPLQMKELMVIIKNSNKEV